MVIRILESPSLRILTATSATPARPGIGTLPPLMVIVAVPSSKLIFLSSYVFFSVKIILGLPTGKSEPDSSLWIGSGDFNQTVGLDIGHSYYPAPFYINGGVTYNNRTEGFSDEFVYSIEGGYKIIENLTLIMRFHGQVSIKNSEPNVIGGLYTYENNQQFIAYSAELVYKFVENFGVKGYYESGGKGKNIISTPVISAGIFFTH